MRTFQICKLQKMRIWPFQIVFLIFGMSKLNFETSSKSKNTTIKIWNYKSVGILRVNPCHVARRGVHHCGTQFRQASRFLALEGTYFAVKSFSATWWRRASSLMFSGEETWDGCWWWRVRRCTCNFN